jgi:hypothetical protein
MAAPVGYGGRGGTVRWFGGVTSSGLILQRRNPVKRDR